MIICRGKMCVDLEKMGISDDEFMDNQELVV